MKMKLMHSRSTFNIYTHGYINLTTLLVKHYNDLLTRRRSGRARNEVTYFSVGDVTTMEILELFPRRFREDFFLKIGIRGPKVYTKNVPNREVCDFIPGPSRPSSSKQVIVVLY